MTLEIADIHGLVAAVELDNIIVHEERARRVSWTEEELANVQLPMTTSSMGLAPDDRTFRFRFRLRLTDQNAEYVSDVEAIYALPEVVDVATDILSEFAGRVAFMAVYPFLRASIFGSAARLGQEIPVLGIVRQGEFESSGPMSPEQVDEEFRDNRSEMM